MIPVVGILLSYLSIYVSPESFWILAVLGLSYPFLLLANLIFILLWLLINPRYAAISLVVVFAGYSHLSNFIRFNGKTTAEPGIEICTFNVKNFVMDSPQKSRQDNAQGVIEYLQEKNPDIICFQEISFFTDRKHTLLKSGNILNINKKKYTVYNSYSGGPSIYSSFPMLNKGEIQFEQSTNKVLFADLKIEKDTVRIYNCHLQSYKISPREIHSLDSISFNMQDESIRDVKKVGSKLKHALLKRAKQAEMLREHIDQSPYPVIVCGDFNETPISYIYRRVRGDLKDAFVESGKGLGNTYRGDLPSLRIDYMMHDDYFESFNFSIDKVEHSDHYPVRCTFIPVKENEDQKMENED